MVASLAKKSGASLPESMTHEKGFWYEILAHQCPARRTWVVCHGSYCMSLGLKWRRPRGCLNLRRYTTVMIDDDDDDDAVVVRFRAESCTMQNGLDLDLLDDNDFYEMRQLTCENELFDVFSEPPLVPERFQPNVEDRPYQLMEHSPLSCMVEDSLVFNFPHPSPSFCRQLSGDAASPATDAAPTTSTSSVDDTDMKPRRGRKRLPETVRIAMHA